MASHQITAPSRALPPVPRGVIHMNVRHVAGFTIIGNHLAQHRGLSLVAIGLAAHIQSLPAGARIGIKVLAARFPESETRIAAALRELEAAGYLRRSRERLPNGRIVTRTVSYNQPGATAPQSPARRSEPAPPRPVPPPPAEPPQYAPLPTAPQAPVRVPTTRRVTTPPLPQPQSSTPELHHRAATLLADLRRHAPQLVLSENDIRTLTPGIVTWLERG
ncbi:MAG TPA: helix-turn-helix domain-containing protein, partial [Streptomyces sp.]